QHSISLVNVAKKVYLSPAYLSSLITRETGKSFTDFLSEIRIKHAVDMLRDKNLKITDIAYKVGFKEPQYFTSTFKKLMNITPRDYREMYLKDT
ncbi:MAG: helix-turn-helix transcriptional regulator, partial [Treponema sp.]|nr:helix-turn-helix transcriptional regulator [Treponema sp.]